MSMRLPSPPLMSPRREQRTVPTYALPAATKRSATATVVRGATGGGWYQSISSGHSKWS